MHSHLFSKIYGLGNMAFLQALQMAPCGLAGTLMMVLFLAMAVGKPHGVVTRSHSVRAVGGARAPKARCLGPQLGQVKTSVVSSLQVWG